MKRADYRKEIKAAQYQILRNIGEEKRNTM